MALKILAMVWVLGASIVEILDDVDPLAVGPVAQGATSGPAA